MKKESIIILSLILLLLPSCMLTGRKKLGNNHVPSDKYFTGKDGSKHLNPKYAGNDCLDCVPVNKTDFGKMLNYEDRFKTFMNGYSKVYVKKGGKIGDYVENVIGNRAPVEAITLDSSATDTLSAILYNVMAKEVCPSMRYSHRSFPVALVLYFCDKEIVKEVAIIGERDFSFYTSNDSLEIGMMCEGKGAMFKAFAEKYLK